MGFSIQWHKFKFNHDQPELFLTSQWTFDHGRNVGTLFVIYKLLVFLFALVNYALNLAHHEDPGYFLIYMTNQGITILLMDQVIATGLVLHAKICGLSPSTSDSSSTTCLVQALENKKPNQPASWVFTSLTWTTAVFITIFYWSILFDKSEQSYFNVFVHGLNSVICFLDLLITARPFRFHHVYVPLIYYFAGGTNANGDPWIYVVLDWSKPGPSIGVVALAAVGLIVIHALVFGAYKLRVWIWNRCFNVDDQNSERQGFSISDIESETGKRVYGGTDNPVFTISQNE
ncbi:hypothetical protein TCAL_11164 [Tigriopus californicus]|uniref:Protein rolling stone n=1 Tax=Tigriopus californicus TaxID=6832 RepID=A0A553NEY6_TIGCA|nr:hypothetical protein TCAL_11164 [Tigriopus californicus]